VEWVAILTEEVGEVAKEAVDFYFANGVTDVHERVNSQVQLQRLENYRMECIQVAAVAVQMVENIDRSLKGI
jgi:tetrahydromethanopterin S-methyltransferase subunit A